MEHEVAWLQSKENHLQVVFHSQAAVLQLKCSKQWIVFWCSSLLIHSLLGLVFRTSVSCLQAQEQAWYDNFCFTASVICLLKTSRTTTAFCVSASFSSALFLTKYGLITSSINSKFPVHFTSAWDFERDKIPLEIESHVATMLWFFHHIWFAETEIQWNYDCQSDVPFIC